MAAVNSEKEFVDPDGVKNRFSLPEVSVNEVGYKGNGLGLSLDRLMDVVTYGSFQDAAVNRANADEVVVATSKGDSPRSYRDAVVAANVREQVYANLGFVDKYPEQGEKALGEWRRFKLRYEKQTGVKIPDYNFAQWSWEHDIPQQVQILRGIAVAYEHRLKREGFEKAQAGIIENGLQLEEVREKIGLKASGHEDPSQRFSKSVIRRGEPNERALFNKTTDQGELLAVEADLERSGGAESELGKRFMVTKETFALGRLRTAQEVVREMRNNNPEIQSLMVFGSTTKGKAREESDIDGWLFVDPGMVPDGRKKELKLDEWGFSSELAKFYSQKLRSEMRKRLNLTEDQVEHLRTLPISESIIDKAVLQVDEGLQKYEVYKSRLQTWQIKNSGPRPEEVDQPDVPLNIYAMFHLAIGNGIRKYRNYLITKLEEMGPRGELIWKEIIADTKMMENHRTEKRYPKTLKQARVVYGQPKN